MAARLSAGGDRYAAEYRVRHRDGRYLHVIDRGIVGRDPTGRIARSVGCTQDITERKRAEEGQRLLSEAGSAFVGALDFRSALKVVAGLAVPTLADYCFFDVLTGEGQIERVGWEHADPRSQPSFGRIFEFVPPLKHKSNPVSRAIRSGKSILVTEVTEAGMRAAAIGPEHLAFMRELGYRSLLTVPLLVDGRAIGALTFCATDLSGRRYGPNDLRLAEELARRAALAVEHVRLYERLREADRRKDEFLATLAHEVRNPLGTNPQRPAPDAVPRRPNRPRIGAGAGRAAGGPPGPPG